jgi:hypothetical protein
VKKLRERAGRVEGGQEGQRLEEELEGQAGPWTGSGRATAPGAFQDNWPRGSWGRWGVQGCSKPSKEGGPQSTRTQATLAQEGKLHFP